MKIAIESSKYGLLSRALVAGFIFLCFCCSQQVFADSNPPTEPDSLQSVRYSSTAGEIFWSPATDESTIIGYRVLRDGVDMGVRDARSLFEPDLNPGRRYEYRVSAVDRFGNEGPAARVELSHITGQQYLGAAEISAAVSGGGFSDDSPSTSSQGLTLLAEQHYVTLVEGDPNGVSISLSLQRNVAPGRPASLSLQAIGARDANQLRYEFSSANLQSDESGSVLTLKLDVGIAPLLVHERHFRIVAEDGFSTGSLDLTVLIQPTRAPDIYLLIGQSNMEGYSELGSRQRFPGGLDERHDRIHQLNVQPNSRSVFYDDWMFSDEQRNVFGPTFVLAEDPLHEPRYIGVEGKEASFVGLGLTFAKAALTSTTADIYLIPAAWGATGFCANANGELAWNASATPDEPFLGGTLLADRAMTRLNMTLRQTGGVLRGILWHQGGADSNNADCSRTYARNLANLASRIRSEARIDNRGNGARGDNASIPFLVATQSKGDDSRARFSQFSATKLQVDAAQRAVADYIPYSDFINNDDLVPPAYPCGQVSCIHYGAAALREQGRRYFAALKRVWSQTSAYHF